MSSYTQNQAEESGQILSEQISSLHSDATPYRQTSHISPIRKELVKLTKHHNHAVVLNQLLYWTQRLKDFDLYVQEEQSSQPFSSNAYGWFYKSAHELLEETLLCVTKVTLRKYIGDLVAQGWVEERHNPQNKWDKTTQYRVNLKKVQADLRKIGWQLSGVPDDLFLSPAQKLTFEGKNDDSQKVSFEETTESQKVILEGKKTSNPQKSALSENVPSKESQSIFDDQKNNTSKVEKLSLLYLTKTTPKTTNKEHSTSREGSLTSTNEEAERPEGALCSINKNCSKKEEAPVSESMVHLWKQHVGQEVLLLTKKRRPLLEAALKLHFENDLAQWEILCKQIKNSPFLMGKGAKGWHITLDWLLREENLLKVIEGNFDSPETLERKKQEAHEREEKAKKGKLLSSIKDLLWKDWCTQLAFPSHPHERSLSSRELADITKARFLEFDGRIVVVESNDARCHDRIGTLWQELDSIVQGTYPTARRVSSKLKTPAGRTKTTNGLNPGGVTPGGLNLELTSVNAGIPHNLNTLIGDNHAQ